jgi:hypothetical protein
VELTRRDAVAALATLGAGVGSGCLDRTLGEREEGPETLAALTAAAEVVYPSAATGHEQFVETFVLGRIEEREAYYAGLREALAALDERAREWYGAPFVDLPPAERNALLEEVGADYRDPDPEGLLGGRVRYYVVNELLYAFYASPTGGRLVGMENPVGHPGGTESYQRGSMPEGGDG